MAEPDSGTPQQHNDTACSVEQRHENPARDKAWESRLKLAKEAYKRVPLFPQMLILIAVAGQIAFIGCLLHEFRWTIIAFFIINFSFKSVKTSIALRWLWKAMNTGSGDSEQGTRRSIRKWLAK